MKERNGTSFKEASLRGEKINRQKRQDRIVKYNLDPLFCKCCNKVIPYEKRINKFCNSSCSASYNNLGVVRNTTNGKWKKKICIYCGKPTPNMKFCNRNCEHEYNLEIKRKALLESGEILYKRDKWYLIEIRSHRCEICKNSEWNGCNIPLDIHHIDGDSDNNKFSNLQLICPNCHRLTSNHGSKNVTSSKRKKYRKKRYDKGLSY